MTQTITRSAASDVGARRTAEFQPASFDPSDNSVELIWTTGAAVTRFDWFDGAYYDETLAVEAKAVRLDRLNAGGPVLASHDQYNLSALIGSVVPGSAQIRDGKGIARIRLSDTEDVADTVAKVKAGHLRNVSVGYLVHTYEIHPQPDGDRDEMRAIDWEPTEISLVAVPADPGCQIRSRSATQMPDVIENEDDRDESRSRSNTAVLYRAGGPSRTRNATIEMIRRACSRSDDFSRRFERELIERHQREPMSEADLSAAIDAELFAQRQIPSINSAMPRDPALSGSAPMLAQRMSAALYARMSGKDPGEEAREFMGVSLIDMTRGLLEASGHQARWLSANKVVAAMERFGAHSTSDFPNVLGNAARRYLLDVFKAYPSPLKPLVRPRTAQDFRAITLAKIGVNPQLLVVNENAEFTYGSVVEAAEGYKLNTYGRIFAISRQALVNDDLGAFTSVFNGWGRAGAELEATLIAALIASNGSMSDGNALYSTQHANLATSASAISVASLGAARLGMRTQKDLDGFTPVDAAPKFLVVGAAKETEAEQALTAISADVSTNTNPFAGKLQLLVDPRLQGNAWYLFADPAAWPVIEVARLDGQEDVYVESRVGFNVDGVETKARVDIGGAAVDWRGTYKNPGA